MGVVGGLEQFTRAGGMTMLTTRNLLVAALVACFAMIATEREAQAQRGFNISPPPLDDKSDLRRWLRRQLSVGASDREERRIRDALSDMKKSQLQVLARNVYRQRLLQASRGFRGGYPGYGGYYPNRGVTYIPQVTWLPSGASLGASAVVSPDRRYVRMNLSPRFYSIPRVDTYNLQTGERRRVR